MTTTLRQRFPHLAGIGLMLAPVLLTACGPTGADEAAAATATQSAQALQERLQGVAASGVPVSVPDVETLAVIYGTDGGVACINVASPFQTTYNVGHFGSASGRRAGIVDPAVIAFDEAVITTYCPQWLDDYQQAVDGWVKAETLPRP